MERMPDFKRAWEYENAFYLTCGITRTSKVLAQWELFRMVLGIPGEIVECGVFKGASLARFATFRQLLGNPFSKKIIGFDTFERYPETSFVADKSHRQHFIEEAGEQSISVEQMMKVLEHKNCEQNVELVAGDICDTVPMYVEQNPQLKISLLNLDTDIYEPAVIILKYLYPHIAKGGILIIDDYGVFPGETKAVDDYMAKEKLNVTIRKFPYCMTPCYMVVE